MDFPRCTGLSDTELEEIYGWMERGTNRTDELRACGNGVVPATAERAFRVLYAELFGAADNGGVDDPRLLRPQVQQEQTARAVKPSENEFFTANSLAERFRHHLKKTKTEENTNMNELMKLAVALTHLANEATEYLKRQNGVAYQPSLPMKTAAAADGPRSEVETMTPNPVPQPVEEPKKARKPRSDKGTSKSAEKPAENLAEETAIADAAAEQASYEKMMEITKQWVLLAKNDTPVDGKTWAMKELKAMGVEKLTDFSHEQRLAWIAKMEGAIAAHK